jgi:hypothetical protein
MTLRYRLVLMLLYGSLDSRYFNANGAGENRLMIEVSFSRHIGFCSELTASHVSEALNDYAWFGRRVKKGPERRKAINSFKLDSTTCYITFSLHAGTFSHMQTLIFPPEGQRGCQRVKAENLQSQLRATQSLCGLTRLPELPSLVTAQRGEST